MNGYYNDFISLYNGLQNPSTIHANDNQLTYYFKKYLIQKIFSVYEFELPEEWDKDYFLYTLFLQGFIAVIKTDKFGVIPQHCSLWGRTVFYTPSNVTISNPLLSGITQPKIGVECSLIKLQPDYSGVYDIITYYAELLALCIQTASSNLINSKLSYVFATKNAKAGAESLKELYDRIASGEPAVFVDDKLYKNDGSPSWELFNQNVGANYITNEILADMNKIMNMFNTDIGINNANFEKTERLNIPETVANNDETQSKAQVWLETMQRGIDMTNKLFNTNLSVKLRYDYSSPVNRDDEEEVKTDE